MHINTDLTFFPLCFLQKTLYDRLTLGKASMVCFKNKQTNTATTTNHCVYNVKIVQRGAMENRFVLLSNPPKC